MYAVQNGTEIKFNTVLFNSYFRWAGVPIEKAYTATLREPLTI